VLLELHDDDPAAATALYRELMRAHPEQRERIWVASEHGSVIHSLRRLAPRIRTAATKGEAWAKLLLGRARLGRWAPRGHVWIVPERHAGLQVITRSFVDQARLVGDGVWAFVVDEVAPLRRLRDWGVAACITTRPRGLTEALTRL
jgi:hypothetical protein